MSKRGFSIYKRTDRRYEARIKLQDGRRKSIYAYTIRDLKEAVFRFIAEEGRKQDSKIASCFGNPEKDSKKKFEKPFQTGTAEVQPHKVSELAEKWLDAQALIDKESSVGTYGTNLRLYIVSKFGDRDIEEITAQECNEYFRELAAHGRLIAVKGRQTDEGGEREEKPLAISTVNGIIRLFLSLVKFAALQGLRPRFSTLPRLKKAVPADGSSPITDTKESDQPDKNRILTKAEKSRLEKYIKEHPSKTSLGVLLTMYTGIRIGELCALKWMDVDLKNKEIRIRHTLQRINDREKGGTKIIYTPPKSRSSIRTIPLIDAVVEAIRASYEDYEKCGPDAFFLTGEKDRFIEPRLMENKFAKLLKDAEVDRIRFHGLRHGFSTSCIEAGMDAKSVCELMGHSSPAITLAIYSHPSMEHKRENLNRIFSQEHLENCA